MGFWKSLSRLWPAYVMYKKAGEALKPKIPEPIMPPTSPAEDDTAAIEAAAREAEWIRKRRGYASTIATSQQGLTTAPTVLKEKLGD